VTRAVTHRDAARLIWRPRTRRQLRPEHTSESYRIGGGRAQRPRTGGQRFAAGLRPRAEVYSRRQDPPQQPLMDGIEAGLGGKGPARGGRGACASGRATRTSDSGGAWRCVLGRPGPAGAGRVCDSDGGETTASSWFAVHGSPPAPAAPASLCRPLWRWRRRGPRRAERASQGRQPRRLEESGCGGGLRPRAEVYSRRQDPPQQPLMELGRGAARALPVGPVEVEGVREAREAFRCVVEQG
jgi:hypothetical protein